MLTILDAGVKYKEICVKLNGREVTNRANKAIIGPFGIGMVRMYDVNSEGHIVAKQPELVPILR